MEEIWIIGIGRFGQIAFQRLSEAGKDRRFVLVDPVAENLRRCKSANARLVVSDGIEFLEKHLNKPRNPDWIIPALPVHLAAEWFLLPSVMPISSVLLIVMNPGISAVLPAKCATKICMTSY
jgi:hypothetical protein